MNIIYLIAYFLVIFSATLFISKDNGKDSFLAGNRNIGTFSMALSIAATWIWAPALLVSAEQSYVNGLVGLFWFTVPNIVCLLLFIPFAIKLRNQMPKGYTLSEYMGNKHSKRVKKIYLFQLSSLALLSTVVQLLAGGKIVTLMTGIPFWLTTLILGLFAYSYSRGSGIKASVFTDALQMVMIIVSLVILVPWSLSSTDLSTVFEGMKGIQGESINFFDEHGMKVLFTFGIPTTIGLIAGPFGDQNFWQRALTVRKDKIKQAFILSAVFFAMVPILMGILGFIASGTGFIAEDASIVNLEILTSMLPEWTAIFFMFMLLSGLLSTLDSNLASISTLTNDIKKNATLKDFRASMLILVLISVLLSNIPVTIIDFFLFYGILRATTFMPTILTLMNVKLSEKGVFYGVLSTLTLGFPLFVIGKIMHSTPLTIIGSATALLLSGIIALGWKRGD